MSGIYKIVNLINNKIYVGSAVNFKNRFKTHLSRLKNNKHHSIILQNSWNKYGGDNFKFEIIEECDKLILIKREQYYIDELKPYYNICKIAGNSLGRVVSDETKEKLRIASTGRKHSNETKEKLSNSHKGIKHSNETKEKLKNINLGKKQTKETIEKRVSKTTGRTNSEETKKKMSDAHIGKKMSSESIEKTRQANLGRIPWNKGKEMSEEQKLKISKTMKNNKKNKNN